MSVSTERESERRLDGTQELYHLRLASSPFAKTLFSCQKLTLKQQSDPVKFNIKGVCLLALISDSCLVNWRTKYTLKSYSRIDSKI